MNSSIQQKISLTAVLAVLGAFAMILTSMVFFVATCLFFGSIVIWLTERRGLVIWTGIFALALLTMVFLYLSKYEHRLSLIAGTAIFCVALGLGSLLPKTTRG